MRFADLASPPQAFGPKQAGLLIIIPAYKSFDNVEKHLECLSGQSFQDFNALFILGTGFERERLVRLIQSRRFRFGILLSTRLSERGGAGAFYAGQRYALENDYKYMILADDDCLPEDPLVVGALRSSAMSGAGYVSPRIRFSNVDSSFRLPNLEDYTSIYHYTLFSSSLVRKLGLIYLPAFGGAEDVEYAERFGGEKREFVSSHVSHRFIAGDETYRKFDKFWVYILNTLFLVKNPRRVLLNLARVLASACAISLFFTSPLRRLGGKIIGNLLAYRYGKATFDDFASVDYSHQLIELDESAKPSLIPLSFGQYTTRPIPLLLHLARSFFSTLRKDVAVEHSLNDLQVTLLSASARKLYYNMGDGKYILLADNANMILHTLKLLLFALLLIICLPLGLLFLLLKLVKQPNAMGYGVDML